MLALFTAMAAASRLDHWTQSPPQHVRVLLIAPEPFLFVDPNLTGNARFTGFLPDLWSKITHANWTHTFTVWDKANGGYNDMITATAGLTPALRDQWDVVLGDVTVTESRSLLPLQFSYPFQSVGQLLVSRTPGSAATVKASMMFWLKPFTGGAWCGLLAVLAFSGAVLYYLETHSKASSTKRSGGGGGSGGKGGKGRGTAQVADLTAAQMALAQAKQRLGLPPDVPEVSEEVVSDSAVIEFDRTPRGMLMALWYATSTLFFTQGSLKLYSGLSMLYMIVLQVSAARPPLFHAHPLLCPRSFVRCCRAALTCRRCARARSAGRL